MKRFIIISRFHYVSSKYGKLIWCPHIVFFKIIFLLFIFDTFLPFRPLTVRTVIFTLTLFFIYSYLLLSSLLFFFFNFLLLFSWWPWDKFRLIVIKLLISTHNWRFILWLIKFYIFVFIYYHYHHLSFHLFDSLYWFCYHLFIYCFYVSLLF